jgi:hypothetical protein
MQRDAFGMLPVVIGHPLSTLSDATRRTGCTAMSADLARVMSGRARDCY